MWHMEAIIVNIMPAFCSLLHNSSLLVCATSLAHALLLLSLLLTAPNYNLGTGNFDECLEIIDDASSCRCGSGLEEIFILDGGAGYVPGTLQVSTRLHITLLQCTRPFVLLPLPLTCSTSF